MILSATGTAATAMAALARITRNRMEEGSDDDKYAKPENNKYSKRRYQLDLQDEDLQRKYFAGMVVVILLSLFLWLLGGNAGGEASSIPSRKKHHIIDVQSQLRRPIRPKEINDDERADDIPRRPMGDVHERLERLVQHQKQHQQPIPESPVIRQDPEEEKLDAIQKLKQYQESLKEEEVILEEEDEIEEDRTDQDEIDHKLKIMELQKKFESKE
jgi:hypothetical protein